jgi:GR25 family glycosyltransferase involved in LPS biosynthesis
VIFEKFSGDSSLPVAFVLGMEKSFRGSKLVTLLQVLGFPVIVCKANILGDKTFDIYEEAQLKFFGRKLSGNEIGCKDSHHKIFEYICTNRIPISVVLEDDAILTQNFLAKLKEIISDKKIINNANIVSLFYSHLVTKRMSYFIHKLTYTSHPDRNSSLLKCATPPYGTVGYIVTLKAAEIATSVSFGYASTADWPYEWCGKVKFYVTNPPLVLHPDNKSSSIEQERSQILDSSRMEEKIKRNLGSELIFGARTLVSLVIAARVLFFRKPIKVSVYKLVEIVSHRYPKLLSPFYKILFFPFLVSERGWNYENDY